MLILNTVNQAEDEVGGEEESEGEEEAIELEKEPEVEEEGREKREEDDEELEEAKERVEEAEEAIEEERDDAEEMTEEPPGAAGEELKIGTALQEADEGVDVVVGDDAVNTPQHTSDEETPTEPGDQVVHESQAAPSQSFGEEREDGEERVKEGVEIDHTEHRSDQEEDGETKQPDEDQPEEDVEQEGVEISNLDVKQEGKDQTEATEQTPVSSEPSSLSLPESHSETLPQESGTITPSKTSTTTVHLNLLSPSSEKVTSVFQQSPAAAYPKESDTPSHTVAATEEEPADAVETAEEEKHSALEEEAATPPAPVEEMVNEPSDQSKVRFTIAPAWQRSLSVEDVKDSLTPPSSPPACISFSPSAATGPGGVEAEAATKKDLEVKAEPASSAKVEVVLSPGRARNAGTKPQSNATSPPSPIKAQTSAAASTEGKEHAQR